VVEVFLWLLFSFLPKYLSPQKPKYAEEGK